jgi:hypothetical protein
MCEGQRGCQSGVMTTACVSPVYCAGSVKRWPTPARGAARSAGGQLAVSWRSQAGVHQRAGPLPALDGPRSASLPTWAHAGPVKELDGLTPAQLPSVRRVVAPAWGGAPALLRPLQPPPLTPHVPISVSVSQRHTRRTHPSQALLAAPAQTLSCVGWLNGLAQCGHGIFCHRAYVSHLHCAAPPSPPPPTWAPASSSPWSSSGPCTPPAPTCR